jgi:transposase
MQGLSDWIGSQTRAFAFIGGVPVMVVSDNLRAGVTKAVLGHRPYPERCRAHRARPRRLCAT